MEKPKLPLTIAAAIILAVTILFSGFLFRNPRQPATNQIGEIYLYGEVHAQTGILEKELEILEQHYQEEGMRHLFVELPYYTAELLNLWMQAEDDQILDQIFNHFVGTAYGSSYVKSFYQEIKKTCPETVFHGTDVGHQYYTSGKEYLAYLENNDQKDSEEYRLAKQAIEQGKKYYEEHDQVYRENCMAENFLAEYDRLIQAEGPTDIMGIYGGAHTNLDSLDSTGQVPCMASQIKERYGEHLHSTDLTEDNTPLKTETIEVNGKEYQASYFGRQDISFLSDNGQYFDLWRLENAYEDFQNCPAVPDTDIFHENFPMPLQEKQVLLLEVVTTSGKTVREYYRTGETEEDTRIVEEFLLE